MEMCPTPAMTPPKAPTVENIQPTQMAHSNPAQRAGAGAPGIPRKPGSFSGLICPDFFPTGVDAIALPSSPPSPKSPVVFAASGGVSDWASAGEGPKPQNSRKHPKIVIMKGNNAFFGMALFPYFFKSYFFIPKLSDFQVCRRYKEDDCRAIVNYARHHLTP